MTMVSRKNVTAAVWPFWMHFVVSLHYISPSTNPLHIMPRGQGQYSNGQSFPANAKRTHNKGAKKANRSPQTPREHTTRVRKRPMKGNSVVPDMPRVVLGRGKRVNTRGSNSIVRPFSRTQKALTDGLRSPCRRFPSLISRRSEMAPLTVNDRAVSWFF